MSITVYEPPGALLPLVKAFVYFESRERVLTNNFYPLGDQFLLATLEGEIVFTNGQTGSFRLPALSMNGQSTAPMRAALSYPIRVLAVQFRPHGCYTIFRQPMNEIVNRYRDVSAVFYNGQPLLPQLQQAAGAEEIVERMTGFLLGQLAANASDQQHPVYEALELILSHKGNIDIKSLLNRIHLTERTLERNFARIVGLRPKTFARICRFNHIMQQLVENRATDLYGAINDHGYFDPSHFIKDFIQFTGCSPATFKAGGEQFELNRQHLLRLYQQPV